MSVPFSFVRLLSTACWWEDVHTSRATLRRFWRGEQIQQDAFISICQAVGISDWQLSSNRGLCSM